MTACSCEKCVALCRQNPGWFAPEGKRAPNTEELLGVGGFLSALLLNQVDMKKGTCVFLVDDRCQMIHDSGFKPIQCRTSLACQPDESSSREFNLETAERWNNPEAQALVREWMAKVGLPESELERCW